MSRKLDRQIEEYLARKKQRRHRRRAFRAVREMRAGGVYTKLSKEQENEVQEFWMQHFGRHISLKWHEYYLRVNGEFSPKYLPVDMKEIYIEPKLKNVRMAPIYSDKNMVETLVGDYVKLPKSYVKNMNGVYYLGDRVVTKQEAMEACRNMEDAVVKHTLDSSQGKSILRFRSENGCVSGKNCPATIEELFDYYGSNFVVQEAIRQSEKMAELNPTSLNTVRIMTYWSKNDGIVPLFAVVRMGRAGAVVDNASVGGMYCGVNNDGSLKEFAYTLTPFSAHTTTDSGVVLKDFVIPKFEQLKAKAIELHSHLPYTKLIGWDLCVDAEDEIELVEINAANPGMFQAATGPAFGDYTEEILELCRDSK